MTVTLIAIVAGSFSFTFHSDSIMTSLASCKKKGQKKFTFHSDSIMTKWPLTYSEVSKRFTFHSDSIMTGKANVFPSEGIAIYISL